MTDHLIRRSVLKSAAMLTASGSLGLGASGAAASDGAVGSGGVSPLDFGADPTGNRDATEALRRWVTEGGDLVLPAGARFLVSDIVTLTRPGTRITGRGTLVGRGGVVNKALLAVEANDCTIDGIFLDNPDRVGTADGAQSFGIELFGHRNRVINCTIRDFQMCLGVAPTGEFYDNIFAFNHCRVIGAGHLGKERGEDRGDGIADFGARTRIIGNMIEAASGRGGINDCRIGIDVEGLPGLEKDGRNADNHAGSEVIGNVVIPSPDGSGRFRRCYAVEGVTHCRVIGNYGRGWTWAGIWLVGASHHSVVSGNVLRQDAANYNRSGAEWDPARAGILVYVATDVALHNAVVADNIVDIAGIDYNGIQICNAGGDISGVIVTGNICTILNRSKSQTSCGLLVTDSHDIQLNGNKISGPWLHGISIQNCADAEAINCRISGSDGFALSAQGSTVRFGLNSIGQCFNGIELSGNSDYLIDGNTIKDVNGVVISMAGSGSGIVTGNINRGESKKIINLGIERNTQIFNNIGIKQD